MSAITAARSSDTIAGELREMLFADRTLGVYAILDAASIPGLLDLLAAEHVEYVCLFTGPFPPVLAEVYPYLVRLHRDTPFTDWLLREGWLRHWGIFALTRATLPALRNHLRRFLIVRHPDGRRLFFRYYDPRVMRVYLPTCSEEERRFVFGPVTAYLCEDEGKEEMMVFRAGDDRSSTDRA